MVPDNRYTGECQDFRAWELRQWMEVKVVYGIDKIILFSLEKKTLKEVVLQEVTKMYIETASTITCLPVGHASNWV